MKRPMIDAEYRMMARKIKDYERSYNLRIAQAGLEREIGRVVGKNIKTLTIIACCLVPLLIAAMILETLNVI